MTVQEAVVTVLTEQLKLPVLRDEGSFSFIAVPFAISDSRMVLVKLHSDEDDREVLIQTELGRVSPARRGAVAQQLAALNAKVRFVVFSMDQQGIVRVDVCVELTYATAYEPLIALSLFRLFKAIDAHAESIFAVMKQAAKQPSRVEREASEIIARFES